MVIAEFIKPTDGGGSQREKVAKSPRKRAAIFDKNNEDEDKLLPRGAGTFSTEEEIDFWQVKTRARTTDVVVGALDVDVVDAWCTLCHKLVNVLRFSELLVKKLATYGATLSSFVLPLLHRHVFASSLSSSLYLLALRELSIRVLANICLPNLENLFLLQTNIVPLYNKRVTQKGRKRKRGKEGV